MGKTRKKRHAKSWRGGKKEKVSPVSSRFIFVFALSQFSGPDYLGAWNSLILKLNGGIIYHKKNQFNKRKIYLWGTKVAVKEIQEIIQSAHNRLLFDREITFVTLVRHPCILQLLAVADYHSTTPLLIAELLQIRHFRSLWKMRGVRQNTRARRGTRHQLPSLLPTRSHTPPRC